MKKIVAFIFAACFVALLWFSLDKITYEPIDSLIRPPKIQGENYDIQSAFEESVGSGYILKSPLAGEYRSSFIRKDINNDGVDEVIVLYSKPESLDVVRINILYKINNKWESISDLESTFSDIQQINFANLDNDNNTEIIVCWRNFENELFDTLNVYKIIDNGIEKNIESIFSKNYNEFLICDVNNDNKNDIIVFEKTAGSSTNEIKGTYYDFKTGNITVESEFIVDPIITSIGAVTYDSDEVYGELRIYIDGYKSDSGITTDFVCWDSYEQSFVRPQNYDFASVASIASRSKNIYCGDVNSDSYIEIPIEEYIPQSQVISANSAELKEQSVIKWIQYYDNEPIAELYEIINSEYSYTVKLQPEHYGYFTVRNDLTTGIMTFYELKADPPDNKEEGKKPKKKENEKPEPEHPYEEDKKSIGDELFSVFVTSEQDFGLYELAGYRLLKTDNGFNYYCQISDKGKENGITKETVKSILST